MWGPLFMITFSIHIELEVGKRNPDEGSIVPNTTKVWKWEKQTENNGRKNKI